ncbi:S-adenosyl-L-methionine-dependent methyltransferase [Periconia macrospinosa]|uniref:tRNA (adenine(58)-N(1))-methyltransferase catalytic subunit TRM61 n=1 Tax=Periconia macrospinosa TaxID=97972 RepID=A0A2V1E880_9PLEO|nr:S-adenosyl-L-methionine-dependent methyltransferase [Periconia macrospinosa]
MPLHALLARRATSRYLQSTARQCFSTTASCSRAFQERDYVLLKKKQDLGDEGTLVRLVSGKSIQNHLGAIPHDDIIGKEPRQLVRSRLNEFRLHEPTLAEYVRFTPRIVTPIYPSDANLIVSLLDLHVDTYTNAADSPPLEILEAGTGHGALTLHLSRAIHAANPPPPKPPVYDNEQGMEDAVYDGAGLEDLTQASWERSRRAVVHTLDISAKHSKHARKIVGGFKGGMYARNVDFHVGDVSSWIAKQRAARKTEEPFLSHVFLDLPNAHTHLANVAPALRTDGMLAIFNPSITQILECVEDIRKHKMPYILDQIVELGIGTIREWDVRAVKPRATLKKALEEVSHPSSSGEESINAEKGQEARDDELAESLVKKEEEEKWAMVCRPKVGRTVVGGGFLGVWRRMEQVRAVEPEAET